MRAVIAKLQPALPHLLLIAAGGVTTLAFAPYTLWWLPLLSLALLVFAPNQQTAYGPMLGVSHVGWVWLIAVLLAAALYWPTRWFAGFKQRSHWRWVRYF